MEPVHEYTICAVHCFIKVVPIEGTFYVTETCLPDIIWVLRLWSSNWMAGSWLKCHTEMGVFESVISQWKKAPEDVNAMWIHSGEHRQTNTHQKDLYIAQVVKSSRHWLLGRFLQYMKQLLVVLCRSEPFHDMKSAWFVHLITCSLHPVSVTSCRKKLSVLRACRLGPGIVDQNEVLWQTSLLCSKPF